MNPSGTSYPVRLRRLIAAFCLLTGWLLPPAGLAAREAPPQAQNGVLDLSGWDFARQGPVSLDGQYQFFWKRLLQPADFGRQPDMAGDLAVLPGYWNSCSRLPAAGWATYRLRIHLPGHDRHLVYGLKITEVLTALRVWIDGTEVFGNGRIGTDAGGSRPEYRPGVVSFAPDGEWTEIVIQVSNFHYRKGGIWTTFVLGLPHDINGDWYRNSHVNLFLIGCLAIMGLYHLGIFFLRRLDRSALWFALFCFAVIFRVVATGDQLLSQWLPGFNWEIGRKLEFFPLNVGTLFFIFFVTTLFRAEVHRSLLWGFAVVGGLFGLAVLVLPAVMSNHLVIPMQVYVLVACAWVLAILVRAAWRRREGAVLVLGGSLVLIGTVANDMLYANQLVRTAYIMPIGFFIFIFIQAFILSMKFSRSFYKAEFLGTALADTNQALRRFVPYEFLEFLQKKSIVDVSLGDQVQKEMCILFCDIRSFTRLSERLNPKENFNFLNSYLGRIGPVIRANGGFIDKYLGDGIMALFPDAPDHALKAAIGMQMKVAEYNEHRAKCAYEPISIGIAINLGHLMLGTIGEADRMDTTVISDAVNLASRMEGLSKIYGPGIIVNTMLIERLENPRNYHWRRLGMVRVRGHQEAVTLVQILEGLPAELGASLMACNPAWDEALDAYAQGDMARAEQGFAVLASRVPDEPAITVYLRRTRHWLATGVPADWDGIEDWSRSGDPGAF